MTISERRVLLRTL